MSWLVVGFLWFGFFVAGYLVGLRDAFATAPHSEAVEFGTFQSRNYKEGEN